MYVIAAMFRLDVLSHMIGPDSFFWQSHNQCSHSVFEVFVATFRLILVNDVDLLYPQTRTFQ